MSEVSNPILTSEQRQQLGAIARERGLRATARAIGISREALCGVIAGMPSHNGTLALAERWLRALETSAPGQERGV